MVRWLSIQLARGALPDAEGQRLFSEDASREMWTPQQLIPISPYPAPVAEATPQFSSYALGWEVEDYRGARIISHGGAVFGVQTMVVLLPGDRGLLASRRPAHQAHLLAALPGRTAEETCPSPIDPSGLLD